MHKSVWLLPLFMAAVMVEGAIPEPKVEKVNAIPWMVPAGALELKADSKLDVPAEGIRAKLEIKAGEKLSFRLIESKGRWVVKAVDPEVAKVEIAEHDAGGIFTSAKATVAIEAVKAGKTILEMSLQDDRDTPQRTFRCYIEVK